MRLVFLVLIATLISACAVSSPRSTYVVGLTGDAFARPSIQRQLTAGGTPVLWVAGNGNLLGFASSDNGNVPPQFLVDGPNPNIASNETATDAQGRIYVMGHSNGDWQISRFRPDSNGNRSPGEITNCFI